MDFALTEEQIALQDTIRSFLRARFDLDAVRRVVDDETSDGNPAELWSSIGAQGWLAVVVPEAFDGLGLGMVDACAIAQSLGAGLVPGPWRSTVLVGEALRLAGSSEQAQWLPRIASGQAVGAIDLGVGVVGDGSELTGTLRSVEYAGIADLLVARAADELFLIDPRGPGITIAPLEQYDGTTRLARVTLAGARGVLLSASPDVVHALTDRAAVLGAAELAGIAREALSRTVAYDATRMQFGVPVGSFQAVKHALADLHVATTMAEHAALYAAFALDASLPDAALAVSVAKAKASETAKKVTADMIQYHGGIGYTWEHETHLFYKRALRLAATFGDVGFHLERVASLAIDPVGARG